MNFDTTLYHYTSGAGLIGIFESDSIWATQIHYLNDSEEFRHAIGQVRDYMEVLWERGDRRTRSVCSAIFGSLLRLEKLALYVACFSEEGDSLSQWRGYCPPGFGYNISFNSSELTNLARQQGFNLRKCIYTPESQRSVVKKWADETVSSLLAKNLSETDLEAHCEEAWPAYWNDFINFAPYMKNPAFSDEREWRLVSHILSNDDRVRLRQTRSMLAPYVPIKLGLKENTELRMRLTVGPTPHQELAIAALAHYLGRYRIFGLDRSRVPYRDW